MKSIQHVLWRGALALGLLAIGIGSGLGMPPIEQTASRADCVTEPRALIADATRDDLAQVPGIQLIVLRRPLSPAG